MSFNWIDSNCIENVKSHLLDGFGGCWVIIFHRLLYHLVVIVVYHSLERVLEQNQLLACVELGKWIVVLTFELLHDLIRLLMLLQTLLIFNRFFEKLFECREEIIRGIGGRATLYQISHILLLLLFRLVFAQWVLLHF